MKFIKASLVLDAGAIVLAGLALLAPGRALAQSTDQWTYSIMPYLWLPSVDASTLLDNLASRPC
jgi:hypothetical protein